MGKEASAPSHASGWRVLIVDDEEIDRVTIKRIVEARGHTVLTASTWLPPDLHHGSPITLAWPEKAVHTLTNEE